MIEPKKSELTPFDKFTAVMRKLVQVPYSEVKAKLDEEKKVRSRKRTQKSKIAAFRAANDKD